MSIDQKTIQNIAFLARIGVKENELKHYQSDINKLLDLVDTMGKIDLKQIEPMFHPIDFEQYLSQDKAIDDNNTDKFLDNAPKADNNFFLVPKVIE